MYSNDCYDCTCLLYWKVPILFIYERNSAIVFMNSTRVKWSSLVFVRRCRYMSRYRGDFFRGSKKVFFPIHLFLNNSLLTYHGFLVKYLKKLFMQQYIVPTSYWVMGHFKNNNWTRFSQALYIVAKIHFKNEIKWILFTKINSRKKRPLVLDKIEHF